MGDWFNTRRLLERIGYVPPAEHEARYYSQQRRAAPIEHDIAAGIRQPAPTNDCRSWGHPMRSSFRQSRLNPASGPIHGVALGGIPRGARCPMRRPLSPCLIFIEGCKREPVTERTSKRQITHTNSSPTNPGWFRARESTGTSSDEGQRVKHRHQRRQPQTPRLPDLTREAEAMTEREIDPPDLLHLFRMDLQLVITLMGAVGK